LDRRALHPPRRLGDLRRGHVFDGISKPPALQPILRCLVASGCCCKGERHDQCGDRARAHEKLLPAIAACGASLLRASILPASKRLRTIAPAGKQCRIIIYIYLHEASSRARLTSPPHPGTGALTPSDSGQPAVRRSKAKDP